MAMIELADDPHSAEERLRRALTAAARVKDRANIALTLEVIAKLIVQDGRYETAVKLYGAAKPLMSTSGQTHSPRSLADREPEFGLAKEQLEETTYQKAWDMGAGMNADEAVEFALSQSTS